MLLTRAPLDVAAFDVGRDDDDDDGKGRFCRTLGGRGGGLCLALAPHSIKAGPTDITAGWVARSPLSQLTVAARSVPASLATTSIDSCRRLHSCITAIEAADGRRLGWLATRLPALPT